MIYNEGQWKISRISPLYKLQYTELKLKQYETKVRQAIVSSVTTNTPTKYTVKFESQPNLVYNEEDAPGLLVKLLSTFCSGLLLVTDFSWTLRSTLPSTISEISTMYSREHIKFDTLVHSYCKGFEFNLNDICLVI